MPSEMWKQISRIELASNVLTELEELLCKYGNRDGEKTHETY